MVVERHRGGSSDVRRPMVKLYSCRSRGTPPGEQIEGTLGSVSMRTAVDLFPRRAIIGSAASLALPSRRVVESYITVRVISWRVCERPEK